MIIELAKNSNGKLSVASLCLKANLSIEEAERELGKMHEKGIFEIELTSNGTIVYVLKDVDLLL